MSTDQVHEELVLLLGAYALDAVDPEEAALIEAHLEECPKCRAELDEHLEMAGALGNSVEPLPSHLWDRIANSLGASERKPELRRVPTLSFGEPADPSSPSGSTKPGQIIDLAEARRRSRAKLPQLLVASGIAAALIVAVLAVGLSRESGKVNQLQSALAAKGQRAAVQAALLTPGHQVVTLTSSEGTALADFVVVPGGRGYLVSSHLAALPGDETYQLWATIDGQTISEGLLGSSPTSGAFSFGSASPNLLSMTVEPKGGVTTPDRAAIASGKVASA